MGMKMFTSSGIFNPTNYGLSAGDILNVICVGGGASGSTQTKNGSSEATYIAGNAGGVSSFGSYLSVTGGNAPTNEIPATPVAGSMGKGGTSKTINYSSNNNSRYYLLGGGAGGYEPGCPIIGGNAGSAVGYGYTTTVPTTVQMDNGDQPTGLGGCGGKWYYTGYQVYSMPISMFGNYAGVGNKGAGICVGSNAPVGHSAGNGYGAGGTAGYCDYDTTYGGGPGAGGNAGSYGQTTVVLSSTGPITVTVGQGGAAAQGNAAYSKASGKGAPGVVIVYW